MEGIEKGKEENFAVPTTDPVPTATPAPPKVKVKPFDEVEYELPFTEEELKELKKVAETKEEEKVLKYLTENLYEKAETLTKDEVASIIQEIPEKYIKRVFADFKSRAETKPSSREARPFGLGLAADAFNSIYRLKDNSVAKKNYQQFITKLLDKYETHEKSQDIAKTEEERLNKERKFIDATLTKIIKEDESAAKQHLKGLSKEERETFNKSYKARIGEMYKSNPNAEALIDSTSRKVKDVFDKAVLEKTKQDKLAKEEEAKRKALLPPQATAGQPTEPTQQRTLSRGRSLIRSKSATKTETPAEESKRVQIAEAPKQEEPKRQQVAEAPKREEPVSSDSKSLYKELRREMTRIARSDDRNFVDIFSRLESKIPIEVKAEDQLDLPSLEQITEAIDKRDTNKLKEYAQDYDTSSLAYQNRNVARALKELVGDDNSNRNRIDFPRLNRRMLSLFTDVPEESEERKFNRVKETLKNIFPKIEAELLEKFQQKPQLKEAFERVKKRREEAAQAQAIPVETPRSIESVPSREAQSEARSIPEATASRTPPSLFSALSRTHQEEAEADDDDEAYQEDLRRAKRESLLEQQEAARNKSGKRAALPATSLETDQDQEIDEAAFQEAAKNYPGDLKPRREVREQPILPSAIEPKDKDGNPMDLTAYIKSAVLRALYDKSNFNMQNPPRRAAFFGEEAPSILANELRSEYAQHGNPLSDQYRARMNQLAELMVKDQFIEQAGEILRNSPDESERQRAKEFLDNKALVKQAVDRITNSPTFQGDIKKYIEDTTYESQAAGLLKPDTTYEGKAAESLENLPDLTPDISFELTPEEKALHEANVKAFIEQATRNFERTDLRRSQNRYSGRNVWNSGLAAQERNEVWQDFNRHLADKQLQMLNEARQQSFLRKKELHEQKVKQAAALLQKSRAWLDTNVLKNRNQTEMANALAGLQGLNLQRGKDYSAYESVLNAGRHGDMQALAALQMTQLEAAQQYERMQHQKDQTSINKAATLGNIGSQHAGQILNASNAYGNMARETDQNLFSRIAEGQKAGEVQRQAKMARDAYEVGLEEQSRHNIDKELTGLNNAVLAAEGLPVPEPTYSLNPLPKPEHIPGIPPTVDNTYTNLAGLGLSAVGAISNYQNQTLANKALEAQTRLYNAQANQIPQIPVAGGEK